MTATLGVLGSLRLIVPLAHFDAVQFTHLRPLHTFFSIGAIVSGILGLLHYVISGSSLASRGSQVVLQFWFLVGFIVVGPIAQVLGYGSGREYLSWSAPVAILLLVPLTLSFLQILGNRKDLGERSPEGLWLFGLGIGLLCLGLIESYLWLIPAIGGNHVRDLTIQWHGIDAFIAGINVCLYGASMFLMDKKARALRSPFLLIVATFSVLFTFGHHHYVSPQPGFLKLFAFIASILAISSFIRHSRSYLATAKKTGESSGLVLHLMRSVQLWTIVSLLSGILFAIPQLNLYLHGTYMVVVHAMGSMIGISLIVYAGVFKSEDRPLPLAMVRRVRFSIRVVNGSITALWTVLGAGGLYKGIVRVDQDYLVFAPQLEWMYIGFVVVGFTLALAITSLSLDAGRVLLRKERLEAVHDQSDERVA